MFFSEIEPFPCAVLAHHYPDVPNYGDMTKFKEWPDATIDVLVGGTPCQSFSVAGLRKGLEDPRGNLMLTYLAIAERYRPQWIVWENVPGVLSSNGGRDFGAFLGAVGQLGYGWAYRVLDAQWFGVAQRRRRVFVVANARGWQRAAAVLFERESLRRDSSPSREKGKGVATDVEASTENGCKLYDKQRIGEYGENEVASTCAARDYKDATDLVTENKSHWENVSAPSDTLLARDYKGIGNQDLESGRLLVPAIPIHDQATRNAGKRGDKQDGKGNGLGVGKPGDPCPTLTKGDKHAVLYENHPNDSRVTGPHEVAPACVSRFGTGGGNVPLVQEAVAFQESELRLTGKITEQKVVPTLKAGTKGGDTEPKVVAIEPGKLKRLGTGIHKDIAPCLKADSGDNSPAISCDLYNQTTNEHVSQTLRSMASSAEHVGGVIQRMAVRRLTPKECEWLQGFPDDHTLIPWRGKPADQCPDGPRYKALGNSMAVPCMAWIGKRIAKAERERQGAA